MGLGMQFPSCVGLRPLPFSHEQCMMQGILDAFDAMTLGPGAPGQQDASTDPAYYPRPTGAAAETAGQAPPPFQPGNCDPRYMRLTCNAIPSQQARPGFLTNIHMDTAHGALCLQSTSRQYVVGPGIRSV